MELRRIVQADACVEVDSNFYSVPWQLIKKQLSIQVIEHEIKIYYNDEEVACHAISFGQRQRSINPAHLAGIIGANAFRVQGDDSKKIASVKIESAEFLRPLSEYEALVGGGWL